MDVVYNERSQHSIAPLYPVCIENTTDKIQDVNIFDVGKWEKNKNKPSYGFPHGITISCPVGSEINYGEIMTELFCVGGAMAGFRIYGDAAKMPEITMEHENKDKKTGDVKCAFHPVSVSRFFSAFQFANNVIDVSPYKFSVDDGFRMKIHMKPKSKNIFYFVLQPRDGSMPTFPWHNKMPDTPFKMSLTPKAKSAIIPDAKQKPVKKTAKKK
jgi:hypothetical protein